MIVDSSSAVLQKQIARLVDGTAEGIQAGAHKWESPRKRREKEAKPTTYVRCRLERGASVECLAVAHSRPGVQ